MSTNDQTTSARHIQRKNTPVLILSPAPKLQLKICFYCYEAKPDRYEEDTVYYPNRTCAAPEGRTTCIGKTQGCMQMTCHNCGLRSCLRYWSWCSDVWVIKSSLFIQDAKARGLDDGRILNCFDYFPHCTIGMWWNHGWAETIQLLQYIKEDIDELAERAKRTIAAGETESD